MYSDSSYDAIGAGAIAFLVVIVLVGVLIGVAVFVLYLLNLQNTLKAVSPSNQKMPPGQVWLMFIPLFNYVWNFIMVQRISESIKAEYDSRQLPCPEEKPAYSIGLAMAICQCCAVVPLINMLAGPATLILWIIYWVKTSEYKKKLRALQATPNLTGSTLA
jgi:hypothetical protein